MAKTTKKSKKVKIGFVTPSDHCAMGASSPDFYSGQQMALRELF